jgi:hypothetical protein
MALLVVTFAACKTQTDEDRVRAVVKEAIEAANARSPSGVVREAIDDFRGPHDAKRDEVKRILAGWFLGAGWVHVFERDLEVTIDGDKAKAKLDAILARGPEVKKIEDVMPTNAASVVFDLDLVRTPNGWRFAHADYTMK